MQNFLQKMLCRLPRLRSYLKQWKKCQNMKKITLFIMDVGVLDQSRQHLWPPAIPRLLHYLLYNVFSASACISKRPASNKKSQKNPQSQKKNPKTTLYPIPHDCVPTFPINPTLTLLLNLYVSIILDYYYNFIMITIFYISSITTSLLLQNPFIYELYNHYDTLILYINE